jgi:hypothetical protein
VPGGLPGPPISVQPAKGLVPEINVRGLTVKLLALTDWILISAMRIVKTSIRFIVYFSED